MGTELKSRSVWLKSVLFPTISTYNQSVSSVPQSCLTLCDSMDHSMPGLSIHCQLPEFTPTHIHWVVMPSSHLILCHPLLLSPSIFASIRVFSNESVLCIRWPKYWSSALTSVLPMNTQDWSPLGLVGCPCSPRDSQESSPTPTVQKHQFVSAQLSL